MLATSNSHPTRTLLFIAILLQLVWGLVPSASKFVIDEIPVELYITIRWSISGFIFGAYLFLTQKWKRITLKDLSSVSLIGILGYGAASFGTLYGLKIGGVTNFALVAALGPAITSVSSIFILRERPRKVFYLALPLSILGLFFIAFGKVQVSSFRTVGLSVAFIIGGLLLESLAFVFSKKFKNKMGTTQYLTVAQLTTALLLWIIQITTFHQTAELLHLTLKGILAAVFVSIVACVLCYAVLYWLLKHIDGHKLALFEGVHTLSATAFGYFLFHEQLSPLMLVGGLLILSGFFIGTYTPKPLL